MDAQFFRDMYTVNSATSLAETPAPAQVPKPRSTVRIFMCCEKTSKRSHRPHTQDGHVPHRQGGSSVTRDSWPSTVSQPTMLATFRKNTKPKIGESRNGKESHTKASSGKNFFVNITENVRSASNVVRDRLLPHGGLSYLPPHNRTLSSLCKLSRTNLKCL